MNGTSVEVTGGLGAFLGLFFLAVAVIFLGYDLSRRLRRLDHQEKLRLEEERLTQERRDRLAHETDAAAAGDGSASTGDSGDEQQRGAGDGRRADPDGDAPPTG